MAPGNASRLVAFGVVFSGPNWILMAHLYKHRRCGVTATFSPFALGESDAVTLFSGMNWNGRQSH